MAHIDSCTAQGMNGERTTGSRHRYLTTTTSKDTRNIVYRFAVAKKRTPTVGVLNSQCCPLTVVCCATAEPHARGHTITSAFNILAITLMCPSPHVSSDAIFEAWHTRYEFSRMSKVVPSAHTDDMDVFSNPCSR